MAERSNLSLASRQALRAAAGSLSFAASFTLEAVKLTSALPEKGGVELASAAARLHELLLLVHANLSCASEEPAQHKEVAHE